jgi:hypothetical protein
MRKKVVFSLVGVLMLVLAFTLVYDVKVAQADDPYKRSIYIRNSLRLQNDAILVPVESDGAAIGTATLEWSDLYMADGAVVYFGDDQEINLTHVADEGFTTNATWDPTVTNIVAGSERAINLYANQTTTALTGTLTGARINARVNVASPSGTVMAVEALAGNQDAGYDLSIVRGVYSGLTNKVPSGAVTWTYARAFEANMDLDQGTSGNTNTITNAYMFYGVYNLPTAGSFSTVTNGYGIYLRNEAVGGTGQALDAALYIDDASMSGGISGWDYGIDMNGIGASGFTVANIRLENGICIFSGAQTTEDGVYGEVGSVDATGSIYLSSGGELFVQVADAGAAADWETVTTTSVD